MHSQLLFGADPEFFASYSTMDGNLFCLPPVFFRTKLGVETTPNGRHPIFVMDKSNNTIMHEDGAAFEISLMPSIDWKDLFNRIVKGRELLEKEVLSKFNSVCNPTLDVVPTIGYDVERWKDEGDEFQYCTQFGCDPDMDAFNTKTKARVIDASNHPFRYGGGHIHISGSKAIKDEPLNAVHSLALTAGLAAVAFSDTPALDKERTYLYGKPGKYRIQQYGHLFNDMENTDVGIEYRTPSNRWTSSEDIAANVFTWVEVGIHYLLEKNLIVEIIKELREPAVDAILNCKQDEAKNILSRIASLI